MRRLTVFGLFAESIECFSDTSLLFFIRLKKSSDSD
jgi:hypothetical protein